MPVPIPPAATSPEIVVTATLDPVPIGDAPVSVTVFDERTIDALALPDASDLLRLSPGISVSTTGPRGTQTQVRIRGNEANHTLLFVDGIRFNDPAAGDEARFELLSSDVFSHIEVVRGPQSALWGADAIGGVIAASGPDPFAEQGGVLTAEYGSLESGRTSGRVAARIGDLDIAAGGAYLSSAGIDSFGGDHHGERDGFHTAIGNLSLVYRPTGTPLTLGVTGYYVSGLSEFDGTDPATFLLADTLDNTRNRMGAVRAYASVATGGWSFDLDLTYLDSANHNFLGGTPLNSTFGRRFTLSGEAGKQIGGHRFTVRVDHEDEDFRARDQEFFGATDQNRSRGLNAFVAEWHADWTPRLVTDIAIRHDDFSAFKDATTFRAAILYHPWRGWTLHAAYGEGIAQPTFFDLYGFFPGSFSGNSELRPERSRGGEAGVDWEGAHGGFDVTGFDQNLTDEIVSTLDPVSFLSGAANANGKSRRRGLEVSGWVRPVPWLILRANYTYLDADEQTVAGTARIVEVRRPRHTANLIAEGDFGRFSFGASAAYVGKRADNDFNQFPAAVVTLAPYVLGSLRVAWQVTPRLEAYVRAENAFDAHYEDVVGFHTPGRTVYAGLRLRFGR